MFRSFWSKQRVSQVFQVSQVSRVSRVSQASQVSRVVNYYDKNTLSIALDRISILLIVCCERRSQRLQFLLSWKERHPQQGGFLIVNIFRRSHPAGEILSP